MSLKPALLQSPIAGSQTAPRGRATPGCSELQSPIAGSQTSHTSYQECDLCELQSPIAGSQTPTPSYPKPLDISSIIGNPKMCDIRWTFGQACSLFWPSGSAETIEPAGFAVFGLVVVDLQGFLHYWWSTTLDSLFTENRAHDVRRTSKTWPHLEDRIISRPQPALKAGYNPSHPYRLQGPPANLRSEGVRID